MQTLLSFLAVIIVVVTVHEFGHYFAARLFGVRVLRFSVGFGKPLLRRRDSSGTEWVIAPIPLGGYVRMLDREAAKILGCPDAQTLEACPHWKRIIIYFAGPFANFILSLIILFGLMSDGAVGFAPIIGEVRDNSPAARVGMVAGERISDINGDFVPFWHRAELAALDAVVSGDSVEIRTESGGYYAFAPADVTPGDMEDGIFNKLGIHPNEDYIRMQVGRVGDDTPAAAAGLRRADEFVAVNGEVVDRWRHVTVIIAANPNAPITLLMWREGVGAITITATLSAARRGEKTIGQLGVVPWYDADLFEANVVTVSRTLPQTFAAAIGETVNDTVRTFQFLRLLVIGDIPADNLSGPIGIAKHSGDAAQRGWESWLRFVALLSISLGVLNLAPLPVLDGGHIVLSLAQMITRRQFSERFVSIWSALGIAFLMGLMVWVLVFDIIRLF